MLTTVFLSLDSVFAGAALRFFGVNRKYWVLASSVMGLADLLALFLGRALHGWILTSMSSRQQGILFACCALAAILAGKRYANYPRAMIVGMAVLFSIDNVLAGAQLRSIVSAAHIAPTAAILSGLACLSGLQFAHAVADRVHPRTSFALATLAVSICFLLV